MPGTEIAVVASDGGAIAWRLNVMPLDAQGQGRSASTDLHGKFLIKGLPAGSFKVIVMRRKGAVDMDAIKRNSQGLVRIVDLARGSVERLELKAIR